MSAYLTLKSQEARELLGLLRLFEGQTRTEVHLAREGGSRFDLHRYCPDLSITLMLSPNYRLDCVVQAQDTAHLWLILISNVLLFKCLKVERELSPEANI